MANNIVSFNPIIGDVNKDEVLKGINTKLKSKKISKDEKRALLFYRKLVELSDIKLSALFPGV